MSQAIDDLQTEHEAVLFSLGLLERIIARGKASGVLDEGDLRGSDHRPLVRA